MLYKVYGDVWLLKLYEEDKCYIIKYFEDRNNSVIEKYRRLENFGINFLKYNVDSECLVIYEDVTYSGNYRNVKLDDLKSVESAITPVATPQKKIISFLLLSTSFSSLFLVLYSENFQRIEVVETK